MTQATSWNTENYIGTAIFDLKENPEREDLEKCQHLSATVHRLLPFFTSKILPAGSVVHLKSDRVTPFSQVTIQLASDLTPSIASRPRNSMETSFIDRTLRGCQVVHPVLAETDEEASAENPEAEIDFLDKKGHLIDGDGPD